MDSLTQIVLGAAVGELVTGRKLGNRAMIWGAVAGTIPDFDVFAGQVADPITNLAFHRCVTHSLYYAVLASPVIAWMAKALYPADGKPKLDYLWKVWLPGLLAITMLIAVGSFMSPTPLRGVWTYSAVVALVTVTFPMLVWGFRQIKSRASTPHVPYKTWFWLFALCIGTHPLLDCFTTYGTQMLQPFDDLRIAWNTISVVDPVYTMPFLVLLLVASRSLRQNPLRRTLTWAGVGISTAYLLFTCFNLYKVRGEVEQKLIAANVPYERFIATPTIFQNVLWNVVIDQGDTIKTGSLGLLDKPFALDLSELNAFPRNRQLVAPIQDERAIQVLDWFSDGYSTTWRGEADTLYVADLRFGILPSDDPKPLFAFQVYPRKEGEEWGMRQAPFRNDVDMGEMFNGLWHRVKGKK
ncbi:MAG: metal-dependent hydrolase [Saprospiraceae bacterium]